MIQLYSYGILLLLMQFQWSAVIGKTQFATDTEEHINSRTDVNKNYKIKLIKQVVGSDVRLTCSLLHTRHAEFMTNSEVRWDFKPCSFGDNRTTCHQLLNDDNSKELDWRPVNCDGAACRVTLIVKNTSENDSGLYRCSISPYKPDDHTTLQIKIVRMYQVDITSGSTSPPELLDDLPANATVMVDSQVVLQCRVHSEVQPVIRWFRKQNDDRKLSSRSSRSSAESLSQLTPFESKILGPVLIKYSENTYELLESAGEKVLTEDTYLSKLILSNVSETDIGVYVCVGINYGGVSKREAHLSLIYSVDYDNIGASRTANITNRKDSNINEFLFLFLIPLGFAIIPIVVWIWYIVKKKKQSGKNPEPLEQPLNNTFINNNLVTAKHLNGSNSSSNSKKKYSHHHHHHHQNPHHKHQNGSKYYYDDSMTVSSVPQHSQHQLQLQQHLQQPQQQQQQSRHSSPQQQYGKHKRPYAIINVNIV